MKKASFTVKKWIIRMLVTVGGVLGFASCQHAGNTSSNGQGSGASRGNSSVTHGSSSASISPGPKSEVEPIECVYGPPPGEVNGAEPVEIDPVVDVYGPPVIVDPQEPAEIPPKQ